LIKENDAVHIATHRNELIPLVCFASYHPLLEEI